MYKDSLDHLDTEWKARLKILSQKQKRSSDANHKDQTKH